MKEIDYLDLLKKHELKATPQRVIFLKELHKAGHLSIEELEARIKTIIPTISTATIYKNINSMVEKGLLYEVKLPGIKTKYEISKKRHAHFFCQKCYSVYDIEVDTSCVKKSIDKDVDIDYINVSVEGICKNCKNSD